MERIWTKHKKINPVRSKTPMASADSLGNRTSNGVNTTLKPKVFVAMSGGVDSSVAALLLKKRGYQVVGVFMRCFNVDGCAERDAEDARRVAEKLNIHFYVWDFEKEYKEKVVDYMINGYRQGITPNPDVMCNREIKFGLFLRKALAMGADYVATGHYVRLATRKKRHVKWGGKMSMSHVAFNFSLYQAKDLNKDQSYFLWTLTQEQLRHCLFPIGDYLKSEVRVIAREAGLPTADKKDSQGICFLGKITLADFLKNYLPEKKGAVLTSAGRQIGEHHGAHFYTIGQRHGLNLSDKRQATSKKGFTNAHYVAAKDIETNTLILAEGGDNPELYQKEIELQNVNFINPQHSNILQNVRMLKVKVLARVRYRQPLAPAILKLLTCDVDNFSSCRSSVVSCKLIFEYPQKFVAPGQSAVFYGTDGQMLGGGVIE